MELSGKFKNLWVPCSGCHNDCRRGGKARCPAMQAESCSVRIAALAIPAAEKPGHNYPSREPHCVLHMCSFNTHGISGSVVQQSYKWGMNALPHFVIGGGGWGLTQCWWYGAWNAACLLAVRICESPSPGDLRVDVRGWLLTPPVVLPKCSHVETYAILLHIYFFLILQ